MATQDDLEQVATAVAAKIDEIKTTLTDYILDVKAAVKKLQDDIAAGGVDLGPAIASLVASVSKGDTIVSDLKKADTEAETISGKPTP